MEHFQDLLIEVWREACRHIEIGESTARISRLLRSRMSIALMIVRRLDAGRGVIETVAVSDSLDRPIHLDKVELTAPQRERVLAWIRRGRAVPWRSGARHEDADAIAPLVPNAITGHSHVLPLASEHGTLGALIVEAGGQQRFTAEQRRMIELLIKPLATALENDQRLHELRALREAAEADNRLLLRRLGRDELIDPIIGADAGLQHVIERVELVARADVPVLILGETGSGKEVIARAIHNRSPRSAGPFIRVNCGAIPSELIDSELFGHEKGAFTGATAMRRGWFERADEGTLFLDEIGELPLAAQVRLLRIIQEGTFERVGGESTIKVDVRIVTATHRDLPAMAQVGRFREDLWYRIAVFPLVLPPLREHKQDIPALAAHFAHRTSKRFGLPLQLPNAQDIALLLTYDWPGNIREFASVIDRAAILGDGHGLQISRALGTPTPAEVAFPAATPAEIVSLDAAMRAHIECILRQTRGRIEGKNGAASLLKINPHTLRARMRKLGIDWSRFRNA